MNGQPRTATPAGNDLAIRSLPIATIAVIAANVVALVAFACSPIGTEYPLIALGIVAFILVQAFLPACRLRPDLPLCPTNLAQGFYCVQLVLVSVLIGHTGFSQGTLPYMPGKSAIDTATLVHIAGYLSFSGAFQWFSRGKETAHQPGTSTPERSGAPYMIVPFFLIGTLGFFLNYGSIGAFIEYATTPSAHRAALSEPATMETALASFLKHFLGFSVVLAWSWWIGSAKGPRSTRVTGLVTIGACLLMIIANFSYNRGTMFGPILCMGAAFSVHVWRIPFKGVALAGVGLLACAFAFGAYRSSDDGELPSARGRDTMESASFIEFVQIYASAPQLPAYYIEHLEHEDRFYLGSTIVPSILYPIPVLGKPHREKSGVYLFNELIYGDPEVLDQIIPFDTEMYLNFHLPGIMLGNLVLGALLSFYQRKFLTAANPAESYAWCMFALWTVFPGSLPVIVQVFVYSFLPIYVYLFAKKFWPSSNVMAEAPAHRSGA
ncbi:MAG TPA: hypothetical protein VFE62_16490 [Gemmataceae bacterium]|nr:hypothetical protein [Gemmataceae bacterium]